MPTRELILVLLSVSLLAGCASRTASSLDGQPQQVNVATNNPLALPPDLSLRAPGNGQAYSPAEPTAPAASSTVARAPVTSSAGTAPTQDVYEQYGVSKTNPDGTEKSKEQLIKELRAAVLKRKQQQNPNYGTIKNFGAIFSDG